MLLMLLTLLVLMITAVTVVTVVVPTIYCIHRMILRSGSILRHHRHRTDIRQFMITCTPKTNSGGISSRSSYYHCLVHHRQCQPMSMLLFRFTTDSDRENEGYEGFFVVKYDYLCWYLTGILCRIVVQYLFCRKREQRHNRNKVQRFQSHDVILSHSFVKSNQQTRRNFASWIFSGVLVADLFIQQKILFSRIECQTILIFLMTENIL